MNKETFIKVIKNTVDGLNDDSNVKSLLTDAIKLKMNYYITDLDAPFSIVILDKKITYDDAFVDDCNVHLETDIDSFEVFATGEYSSVTNLLNPIKIVTLITKKIKFIKGNSSDLMLIASLPLAKYYLLSKERFADEAAV